MVQILLFSVVLMIGTTAQAHVGDYALESEIERTARRSVASDDASPLVALAEGLDDQPYWQAFAYMQVCFCHSKAKSLVSEAARHALDAIEACDETDVEVLALRAMIEGVYGGMKGFPSVMRYGMRAGDHIEEALELSPDNPRALLVYAFSDFYRPRSLGGGDEVLAYAQRSLAVSSPSSPDSDASPYWGRRLAYGLLILYYKEIEDAPKMRETARAALVEYPGEKAFVNAAGL